MAKAPNITGFPGLANPDGQRLLSPSYRVGFSFYPQPAAKNPFVQDRSSQAIKINWFAKESEAGLSNFSWSKQLGQGAGRWTAAFKQLPDDKGVLDFRKIVDGDWVDVAVLRNGVRIPLCRGVVDQIREQTRSMGGATVRVWNLIGRDHGAIFEYPITWASIWTQTLGEIVAGLFTHRAGGKIGGRPDQLFGTLITGALAAGKAAGQWELPPSLAELCGGKTRLYDILKVVPLAATKAATSKGLRGAFFNQLQLWNTGAQTLHQAIMTWCNPLLNEIYYDLIPPSGFMPRNGLSGFVIPSWTEEGIEAADPKDLLGAIKFTSNTLPPKVNLTSDDAEFGHMGAYIRERPFINTIEGKDSLWFSLPTWTVPDWLIASSDLGIGGQERYNLFELLADLGMFGPSQEQPALAPPSWYKDDIRARGLRAFQQTTIFLAAGADMGAWLVTDRSIWQRLLTDWYGPNPHLRSGTITFKVMLPEIRVGHRLIVDHGGAPEGNEQFYIEGVDLDFTFPPGSGSTTLTLTHGFTGSNEAYLQAVRGLSALYTEVQGG